MDSNAVSSHGTLVKRNGTTIGELGDITPPPLTRKSTDVSIHNSDDDQYVVGIRRKGELQFTINFLPSGESTHNAETGLLDAWVSGTKDQYEVLFTDGATWLFSGFVVNVAPKQPVDGNQSATINVRPTGGQIFTP